jgi:hypothetical protein
MRLTLRIDRLVVDGLPLTQHEQRAFAAAIENELSLRLRRDAGAWPSDGLTVRAVRGGPLGVVPGRRAADLGTEVAGSIHAALGQAVRT